MPKEKDRMDSLEETMQELQKNVTLMDGMCPKCNSYVKGWQPPITEFVQRTLTDQGTNFKTGHKITCR